MIYNPDKLKQILPVKLYQAMDCVINVVLDSSILPEIFPYLKIFIMQWKKNTQNETKRMVSYT